VAVVQISRIQHRTGVSDNLPQLARGEIGLAVDTRKVYIGNGGTNAPTVENLEILTNRSDVIALADIYTYKDSQIGFSAQTGASSLTPIERSLQDKLDDIASVRDFGAVGDGVTDDTAAINRALYELFAREQINRVRRSLLFPGGKYLVSDTIKIPAYAKLVGEGPDSTFIYSAGDTTGPVSQTADSLQQVDASVGSNSADQPNSIVVRGITFQTEEDIDVFLVDQASSCYFENCNFYGAKTSIPTGVGNSKASVRVKSSTTYNTKHVNFRSCVIAKSSFGVVADNDMQSVLFDGCRFYTSYKGLKIGENVTGSAPSLVGPTAFKVINSHFDDIYNSGIHVYNGPHFNSGFNYFADVANNGLGNGSPSTHVINLQVGGAYSLGDCFDRPDSDDSESTRRVNVDTGNVASLATDNSGGVKFGSYIRGFGTDFALANNTSASTGITFSSNSDQYAIEIEYMITRNNKIRQGTMRITHDSTAQVIEDDFSENNGDVGVTFSLTNGSDITTLNYTTDNQTTGTLHYAVRTIR